MRSPPLRFRAHCLRMAYLRPSTVLSPGFYRSSRRRRHRKRLLLKVPKCKHSTDTWVVMGSIHVRNSDFYFLLLLRNKNLKYINYVQFLIFSLYLPLFQLFGIQPNQGYITARRFKNKKCV